MIIHFNITVDFVIRIYDEELSMCHAIKFDILLSFDMTFEIFSINLYISYHTNLLFISSNLK